MILPLTHERMTVQRLPWVTIVIIALNLAVFHHQQGRTRQGLSILDELSPLAASHPEWQSSIDEKRQAFRAGL